MSFIINKILGYFQFLIFAVSYLKPTTFNEIKFLKNQLPNGALILDVGANVGTFSKTLSKYLKIENLNFHLFEPNVNLLKILDKLNIKNNHSKTIVNKAITNNESSSKVIFYERNISAYSSIKKNNLTENHKIVNSYEVGAISLDKYINDNNFDKVDLLKIDTEGLDYEVLLSAKNSIRDKKIKIIKIELIPNSENFYNIFNFLELNNYELCGLLNLSYFKNKLLLFDAYFKYKN